MGTETKRLSELMKDFTSKFEKDLQDGLKETEAVMAPIRKKVARVEEDLVLEQKIRQVRSEELMKDLIEATDSLNNTLDVDKFNREQYFKDLEAVTVDERESLEKRQIVAREEVS